MSEAVIDTRDLQKQYREVQALKGVTVRVGPGQIYGLLGQNGAGKSTLIKILLGIVKKTNGEAQLLGKPAGDRAIRQRVGYLPEDHQFPGYHTAASLLDVYGRLYGMTASERKKRSDEACEIVGIRKRMNDKVRTYSKGMKQRLGIAQAFFHDPDVIFLDEPTDGVDPVGRREIRDLLTTLKHQGRTIFINSHLLGEVELICDRVAILQRGELVREGTVAELTKQEGRFELRLASGQNFPVTEVEALGVRTQANGELVDVIVGDEPKRIDAVVSLLSQKGLSLRHLVEKKQSLEDVFVKMVDQAAPGTDDRNAAPRARRIDA